MKQEVFSFSSCCSSHGAICMLLCFPFYDCDKSDSTSMGGGQKKRVRLKQSLISCLKNRETGLLLYTQNESNKVLGKMKGRECDLAKLCWPKLHLG